MGYLQHKYTRGYFLRQDENGQPAPCGVVGVEDFQRGTLRAHDLACVSLVNFKAKSVLEIGFGRGEALKYAFERGAAKIVGVDFSRDAVAIAKEFLGRYHIELELICADALEFVKAESNQPRFDIVVLLDVIEHVPRPELARLLKEMRRILKPKAVLIINTPVFAADNDLLAEGLKRRARDESDDFPQTQGMHCNRYTKASLRRFMRACGYRAIGGHHFLNWPGTPPRTFWPQRAWRKAFEEGYPLLSPVKPKDQFELAFSVPQTAVLRRLYASKHKLVRYWGPRLMPVLWRVGL